MSVDVHTHDHVEHAPPKRPPTGIHRFLAPGWLRALWTTPLGALIGLLFVAGGRAALGYEPLMLEAVWVTVLMVTVPLGFLTGIGGFDYWAYWISGRPTRPEDHSGHGALQLEGLLPDQHRPQGDRRPVPGHDDRLLHPRRAARDVHARRAGAARDAVREPAGLQRPLLGARVADDLPVHHPGLRRTRELRHPADDRRAGHGVPAPERALVLAAPDRRAHDALELLPRRVRRRLDELRAARGGATEREPDVPDGRPVGGCVLDHDRPQLPGHDHHHARAGDDLLAHAAPRLGELRDLDARRHRDAVHRRVAVLHPLRPRPPHGVLQPGRGRLRDRVPAHLLVLLAPGRLHHDAARIRDRLGGDRGLREETDLRLPADGAVAHGHPHPRVLGVGAPHVRERHGRAGCASR